MAPPMPCDNPNSMLNCKSIIKRIVLVCGVYLCFCQLQIAELKVIMDLYEELIADTNTLKTCKNVPETPPLSDESHEGAKSDQGSIKPPEVKSVLSGNTSENLQTEAVKLEGTYIVGGSAFGWNFITFPSTKVVYYGRTKEAFRLQIPVSM